MSKRNTELDVVKGIGIVFMVLGHMHFSNDVFNHYIYAFHMPLFFIVSGMLYSRKVTSYVIKRRAKALMVPYVCFGGGYWLIYNLYCSIAERNNSQWATTFETFLIFPTKGMVIETALWFLPVMFLTTVVYSYLDNSIGEKKIFTAIVFVIGVVGFVLPKLIGIRLPWGGGHSSSSNSFLSFWSYHKSKKFC